MSGGNLSGPVPSRLAFLHDLQHMPVGDKVRFLGWFVSGSSLSLLYSILTNYMSIYSVQKYSIATGTLTVTHHYPNNLRYPAAAHVNIEHVLERIKGDVLAVGEWINITGYITGGVTSGLGKRGKHKKENERSVSVQAVMLWSAGQIKVPEYEVALEERLRSDSLMKKSGAT